LITREIERKRLASDMQIEKMIRMGMRCEEAFSNPIPIVLPASFAKFIEANWSYKYNTRPTNIRIAGDTQTYIGLFIVYRQEAFSNWKQSDWRQRKMCDLSKGDFVNKRVIIDFISVQSITFWSQESYNTKIYWYYLMQWKLIKCSCNRPQLLLFYMFLINILQLNDF